MTKFIYHFLWYRWKFISQLKTLDNIGRLLMNYCFYKFYHNSLVTRDLIKLIKIELGKRYWNHRM